HARATAAADDVVREKQPTASMLYDLACVWALSSAAARLDAQLDSADRDKLGERYATRALELLSKAQAAGHFNNPARTEQLTKDPDLDPLRARYDFKKLLVDVQKQVKVEP